MVLPDRIARRIDKNGPNGCWLWTGSLTQGYGQASAPGGRGYSPVRVHRFVYEELVGPIPAGAPLDHTCGVRACCNPAHLEPVTTRENNARRPDVLAARSRNRHPQRRAVSARLDAVAVLIELHPEEFARLLDVARASHDLPPLASIQHMDYPAPL